MTPENGAVDSERIHHEESLLGSAAMEIDGHGSRHWRRAAVARSIGDDEAALTLQRFDLAVDGIDAIAPSAVQKNDRKAAADIAVVNANRVDSRGMGRTA